MTTVDLTMNKKISKTKESINSPTAKEKNAAILSANANKGREHVKRTYDGYRSKETGLVRLMNNYTGV